MVHTIIHLFSFAVKKRKEKKLDVVRLWIFLPNVKNFYNRVTSAHESIFKRDVSENMLLKIRLFRLKFPSKFASRCICLNITVIPNKEGSGRLKRSQYGIFYVLETFLNRPYEDAFIAVFVILTLQGKRPLEAPIFRLLFLKTSKCETLTCVDELVCLQSRPLTERLSTQLTHEVLYTCRHGGTRMNTKSRQKRPRKDPRPKFFRWRSTH